MSKRILLFGGTFNPIHNGHLIISRHAAENMGIDKIILIPNGDPPHKKNIISKEHRYNMLKKAILIGKFKDPLFDISRYEIDKLTPSYLIETIRKFKNDIKNNFNKFYFLIGPDSFVDLKNWYKFDELIKECIFIVGVDKFSKNNVQITIKKYKKIYKNLNIKIVDIPYLEIRATDIRNKIQQGFSIRNYVPETVERYIQKNELYSSN
jgi:nicotinate-nucleotide adenylyltransferase